MCSREMRYVHTFSIICDDAQYSPGEQTWLRQFATFAELPLRLVKESSGGGSDPGGGSL